MSILPTVSSMAATIARHSAHIPFFDLAASDPLGDAQQRIAEALRLRKPLDLGGKTVQIPLAGQSLLVPGLTIRNGRLELDGLRAGQLAIDSRPQPRTLATDWSGGKRGDVRIHLPGHGLSRGSIIWIYGRENWAKDRYYLMSGDVSNVLEVDGDYLILGRPLRFGYDQTPAEKVVGARPEEFSRFRLENMHIRYTGPENVYGVWHRYTVGQAIDNVLIENFRSTLLYTEDSVGADSNYQPMALSADGGGTNYGHALIGLYLWQSSNYNGLGAGTCSATVEIIRARRAISGGATTAAT
ncbi:hypothetical protein ACFP81_06350 [Deinococcus lacus]|uniref:Uncharacterized protein n=1 Tax=Deinococcus lacus TaxID=392561 RepID=A0ABW1YCA0_9DEIO